MLSSRVSSGGAVGPARESLPGEGLFLVSCQRGLETRALGLYENLERSSRSLPLRANCAVSAARLRFLVANFLISC